MFFFVAVILDITVDILMLIFLGGLRGCGILIFPLIFHKPDVTQGQFLSRFVLGSVLQIFIFLNWLLNQANEHSLPYYLFVAGVEREKIYSYISQSGYNAIEI